VLQSQPHDGLGDAARFVRVERTRAPVSNGSKGNAADVAHQHKVAVRAKTFADIRARFLAHGMELEFCEQRARADIRDEGARTLIQSGCLRSAIAI
jgi:hypothetical protein